MRQPAVSHGFAELYLHGATLVALAPACLVAVGVIAPKLGLMSEGVGVGLVAMEWVPHVALASVAAGFFGVLVAMLAGFSKFWLRALLVLAITTATLFAYVWDREGRQPTAGVQAALRCGGTGAPGLGPVSGRFPALPHLHLAQSLHFCYKPKSKIAFGSVVLIAFSLESGPSRPQPSPKI